VEEKLASAWLVPGGSSETDAELQISQDRDSRVRDQDRGRGSENSVSRLPRGEAVPTASWTLEPSVGGVYGTW